MEKTYVIGHKKPDTDSVTAAIALSNLKNKLGLNTEPRVLGPINKETKFVLDYFNVPEPMYLDNVYLQIKDVDYHKNLYIPNTTSVLNTYNKLKDEGITGIPLVSESNVFAGLITVKMILKEMINGDANNLDTSYNNLLEVLNGEEIVKCDDEIKGSIIAAAFRSTTFMNNIKLTENDILIVGDRHSIIEYAVNSKVKLIVIVGNGEIHEEHIAIAKANNVNIIRTELDSFHTAKLIGLSNYIKDLIDNNNPYVFDENTIFDEFEKECAKLKHNNYPIINKNGNCLGLMRITDIKGKNRKKVILVDHNEEQQSVTGLDEAEIVEIVDHHKIGDLTTNNPINFRNMAVGSTDTIVYNLYKESNVEIDKKMAGVMISGILSDTLNLTSPTTTDKDKQAVIALAKIAELDANKYAMEMLKAGTSFEGMSYSAIINTDLKVFPIKDLKIAIGQVFTFNVESIMINKNDYLKALEEDREKNGYTGTILVVTDILANGSYIFYTESIRDIIESSWTDENIEQGFFLEGCVSRKKQVVPPVVSTIEGK